MDEVKRIFPRRKRKEDKGVLKGSANGLTPFFRHIITVMLIFVVALIPTILNGLGFAHMFPPIISGKNTMNMTKWVILILVVTLPLVYLSTILLSTYILTQSSWKYCLWLMKDGIQAVVRGGGVALSISVIIFGIASASLTRNADKFIENTDFTIGERTLMISVLFTAAVCSWCGLRTAWKIVRFLSAKTMQMRYEDDLLRMETMQSGQWWDRNVSVRLQSWLGRDGNSPRFIILWIVLLMPLQVLSLAFGLALKMEFIVLWGAVVSPVYLSTLWAAVAKYRDGRYKSSHQPYFIPVRDKNTKDEYDPEKIGVRAFIR